MMLKMAQTCCLLYLDNISSVKDTTASMMILPGPSQSEQIAICMKTVHTCTVAA